MSGVIGQSSLEAVPAVEVRRSMRRNRVTIRQVAKRFQLTLIEVRRMRDRGAQWDWPLMMDVMVRERAS